jgi:arylsulfatase A
MSRLFLFLTLLALAALPGVAQQTQPNILIILADDLGYGDAQCYNPTRGKIPTPCIDQFASQGMLFTDAYAATSVCSPSRYALMTGRYPWRTSLQHFIVDVWAKPLIAPDRLTLASFLKQQGYRTAMFGKWHLGDDWHIPAGQLPLFKSRPASPGAPPTAEELAAWQQALSQPITGGPFDHGFDTYFGTDVPNWPPYAFIQDNRVQGTPTAFLPQSLLSNYLASVQGPALAGWKLEDILPTIIHHTCDYLAESAHEKKPFFIYLAMTAPHTPLAVVPEWSGKSGLHSLYADYVMQTDAAVGQVLDALDKSGQADNTLVIFSSDNGFAAYVGGKQLEAEGHFPSGPLRGYKFSGYEGGFREPFIVRWPGVVRAGARSDQVVQLTDLMATFADVLGVKLPVNAGEDSTSFLPLLKGVDKPVHDFTISTSSPGVMTVRRGPWRFIAGNGSGDAGGKKSSGELYNLSDDLGETKNLYAQNPGIVADLTAILEKSVDDGRTTPGPQESNDVPVEWRRFLLSSSQPFGPGKPADGLTATQERWSPRQKFLYFGDWSWMHDD